MLSYKEVSKTPPEQRKDTALAYSGTLTDKEHHPGPADTNEIFPVELLPQPLMMQNQPVQKDGGGGEPLQDIFDSMDPADPLSSVSDYTRASYDKDAHSEALSSGRRMRHIIAEQRRRNHSREAFEQLSELLSVGRDYGARALGLNSGAGTGVEDEELDDRSDTEEDLLLCCDEDEVLRRKRNAQRRARNRAGPGKQARGKGRGRGGSAGHAGSKSAVLFQVIDLIDWLDGRDAHLEGEIRALESVLGVPYTTTPVATGKRRRLD